MKKKKKKKPRRRYKNEKQNFISRQCRQFSHTKTDDEQPYQLTLNETNRKLSSCIAFIRISFVGVKIKTAFTLFDRNAVEGNIVEATTIVFSAFLCTMIMHYRIYIYFHSCSNASSHKMNEKNKNGKHKNYSVLDRSHAVEIYIYIYIASHELFV